jgi:hypothetical protein
MVFKRPPTSVDAVLDDPLQAYMAWREECRRVAWAYRRWHAARGAERGLAFVACHAALDGEDRAAAVYRTHVEGTAASAAPRQPSLT